MHSCKNEEIEMASVAASICSGLEPEVSTVGSAECDPRHTNLRITFGMGSLIVKYFRSCVQCIINAAKYALCVGVGDRTARPRGARHARTRRAAPHDPSSDHAGSLTLCLSRPRSRRWLPRLSRVRPRTVGPGQARLPRVAPHRRIGCRALPQHADVIRPVPNVYTRHGRQWHKPARALPPSLNKTRAAAMVGDHHVPRACSRLVVVPRRSAL